MLQFLCFIILSKEDECQAFKWITIESFSFYMIITVKTINAQKHIPDILQTDYDMRSEIITIM